MTRQIIFHIGLQKTGTTSFQHFCFRNRQALLQQGLLYPKSCMGRHRNHAPLVLSYNVNRGRRDYSLALRSAPHDDAVAALMAEIKASGAPRTLVSAEHFSLYFGPQKVKRLAVDFADFDIRVLVTVRDHMARFVAAYGTHVAAGGTLTIEDYAASVLQPGMIVMSVKDTLPAWQNVVGASQVRVVDYDAEKDLIAALLAHCGINHRVDGGPSVRHRVSLDADTTQTLRLANLELTAKQSRRADQSFGAWLQLSFFSILCRRRLVARRNAMAGRPWHLIPEVAARIDDIAAADRRWLQAQYGIELKSATSRAAIEIGGAPDSVAPADLERARTVVRRATRGLWIVSEAFVRLWSVATRLA